VLGWLILNSRYIRGGDFLDGKFIGAILAKLPRKELCAYPVKIPKELTERVAGISEGSLETQ